MHIVTLLMVERLRPMQPNHLYCWDVHLIPPEGPLHNTLLHNSHVIIHSSYGVLRQKFAKPFALDWHICFEGMTELSNFMNCIELSLLCSKQYLQNMKLEITCWRVGWVTVQTLRCSFRRIWASSDVDGPKWHDERINRYDIYRVIIEKRLLPC